MKNILVIGLGNPSKKYADTRHNVGFQLIDFLAESFGLKKMSQKIAKAEIYEEKTETGGRILFVKPMTFMNLSGEAVCDIASFYKIESKNILVASDDIYLKFGLIRVRTGGASGGHNGLNSIIKAIGPDFWRLRIGIGPRSAGRQSETFVLSKFSRSESEKLAPVIDQAAKLVVKFQENHIKPTTISCLE